VRLRDRLVGLGLLVGVLGLAGCANGQPAAPADEPSRSAAGPSAGKSSTSFLTYGNSASAAELAALKRRAGIEPCPRTDGPAGTTAAGLPALPGALPTMADWSDHMTTAFPEVRMKKFLEMRGADESGFLDTLIEFAEANETPAERKLALFQGEWNGDIDRLFGEFAY